jgi:hypothetical protein
VGVDSVRERTYELHESRCPGDVDAEYSESLDIIGIAGGERELR